MLKLCFAYLEKLQQSSTIVSKTYFHIFMAISEILENRVFAICGRILPFSLDPEAVPRVPTS